MTETTELDRTRRYLRPVARLQLPDQPDLVHLSVYEWLPQWEEWATGLALCGYSTEQGALPDGTAVTCPECEAYRPRYERYLTPGYKPDDDDPTVLRARIAELERERDVLRRALARLSTVVAQVAALAFGHRDSRGKALRVKWRTADRVLAYVSGPVEGCDCDRTLMIRNRHVGHLVTCPQDPYRRPRHYDKEAGR
ncbi:hypothetical protein AB0D12_31930 [Streptomyces sp. NPDC048479]|uniref:hypothetical protein n=1 Tax=Streptomyces sp. NPDC048479 TaxID=3154725 RepID=UPI00342EE246